jgi:hypothetical protein
MIVSDACSINVLLVLSLALTSVVNYAHKGCHSLERHLQTTLESSFMIIISLKYFAKLFTTVERFIEEVQEEEEKL